MDRRAAVAVRLLLHRVANLKNWEGGYAFSFFTSLQVPFSSLHPQHTLTPASWQAHLPTAFLVCPPHWQQAAGEAQGHVATPLPNPGKEQAQNEPSGPWEPCCPPAKDRLVGHTGTKGCKTWLTHSPKGWLVEQRASDTKLRTGQNH